jgi:Heterokaryon incompatibility protein (HET)
MSDTSKAELFEVLDTTKKQIRLLTLFPGKRGSQVECSLAVISLLSNPKYKALSYEWGSTDSVNEIVVNDRKLQIRDNLWWALNYLRKDDREIVIWIDAICIDQSNLSERNYQVELMREIFTCAIHVEAWIGLGSESSANVFKILRELNCGISTAGESYTRQGQKARDRLIESQWVSWMNSGRAFDDVFERSYWNRVWIIQEVIVAKELFIRCGEDSIRWHPGFVQEFDRAAIKHPDQMWVFGFF